jgi:hypothetical protein
VALIKVKNPNLYRRWLTYLRTFKSEDAAIRTEAFFNSEAGHSPPFA